MRPTLGVVPKTLERLRRHKFLDFSREFHEDDGKRSYGLKPIFGRAGSGGRGEGLRISMSSCKT
jgi:hypothetical protein